MTEQDQTAQAIEKSLRYVKENLFCPRTNLIHDHKFGDWRKLPKPEEIAALCPNPGGYGTGMEDCMINTGSLMDAMITRVKETRSEEDLAFLHALTDGLCRNAEAGKDGFLPRGRSPWDGESHYPDSSRDQYTLFLYALHLYLNSGFATTEEHRRIHDAVIHIAERAIRNVNAETGYDLLREDGRKTISTQMWGNALCNHEVSRLPMIYLCAWHVSGDERYLSHYRALREEMYSRLLPMTDYWHVYCVHQMQISLQVLTDLDPDPGWKDKFQAVMLAAAQYCITCIPRVRKKLEDTSPYRDEFLSFRNAALIPWARQIDQELPAFHPNRPGLDLYFDLWDAAHILFCNALAGSPDTNAAFAFTNEVLCGIDFEHHVTGAPTQFLQAYYTWKSHCKQ